MDVVSPEEHPDRCSRDFGGRGDGPSGIPTAGASNSRAGPLAQGRPLAKVSVPSAEFSAAFSRAGRAVVNVDRRADGAAGAHQNLHIQARQSLQLSNGIIDRGIHHRDE